MTVNLDDLPKPERGATEADVQDVQQLPSENVPNVAHLLPDGGDEGTGGFGGTDAEQTSSSSEQQQGFVVGDDTTGGQAADDDSES